MNVSELQKILSQCDSQSEVVICLKSPFGSIGATPFTSAEKAEQGIDWDNGRLLIYTKEPLTKLSPADLDAIKKSAKAGQSWQAYNEYKKLRTEIEQLKKELKTTKAALTEPKHAQC